MNRIELAVLFLLFFLSSACCTGPRNTTQPEKNGGCVHTNPRSPGDFRPYSMLKCAVALANDGRPAAAVGVLRKVLTKAPDYLPARVQYVIIRTFYQQKYEAVRKEYDLLMLQQPGNPVFPLALLFGTRGMIPDSVRRRWLEKISQSAPETPWSHYARAELVREHNPEEAAHEFTLCIDGDGTQPQPYLALISLQANKLHKPEDAMATAQRMTSQAETHVAGQYQMWKLRLAGGGANQQVKTAVRAEIDQLAASSTDIEMLTMLRNAYSDLLFAPDGATSAEQKLRQLDPGWYAEKSAIFLFVQANGDGIPRQVPMCCKSVMQLFKAYFVPDILDPHEQISRLEEFLKLRPGPAVKQYIYERLLSAAQKAGDPSRVLQYARALHAIDPGGVSWLAKLALALADTGQQRDKALRYARLARTETIHSLPVNRAPNTDPDWFHDTVTVVWQKTNLDEKRALALDAYGWVLYRIGDLKGAEASLRESIRLSRSEDQLHHLAETLRAAGRTQEADDVAMQAREEHVNAIRQKMLQEPAPQFELATIDGAKVRLSDLKGKVVMLYFFTTWCASCSKEKLYLPSVRRAFSSIDFALLGISLDHDSDHYKLGAFVKDFGDGIQFAFGEHIAPLYKVPFPPGIIIIDKQGLIRYREIGFTGDTPSDINTVIAELLK